MMTVVVIVILSKRTAATYPNESPSKTKSPPVIRVIPMVSPVPEAMTNTAGSHAHAASSGCRARSSSSSSRFSDTRCTCSRNRRRRHGVSRTRPGEIVFDGIADVGRVEPVVHRVVVVVFVWTTTTVIG